MKARHAGDDAAAGTLVIPGLFLISAVGAAGVGFLPERTVMAEWFHASGFWFIFAAFLLWLSSWKWDTATSDRAKAFTHRHGVGAGLALLLTVSAFLSSPPDFRILADETNLLGTASAMYDRHSFYNPTQVLYYYEGIQNVISKEWDKRPLFFPFMVFLAHTFTGYREGNVFLVNFFCSWALLFGFYLLLTRWFTRTMSVIGMALLASIPLVVLWMTSGGFEIANLAFGVLAFLFAHRLVGSGSARHAEWLAMTLVLLSQIRYESVIFAVALLPLIPLFMRREEWTCLSWRVPLLPWLFLPVVWQRLTSFNDGVFQMNNGKAPFSFEWLWPNLQNAFRFFTSANENYAMIPALFWLALPAAMLAIWYIARTIRQTGWRPLALPASAFTVVFLNAAILFLYFWGNLTLQYALRLGLIFVPFQVALVVFGLDLVTAGGARGRRWLALGCLALIVWYWPVAGANGAVREILIFREFSAVRRFLLKAYPQRDVVVISDISNCYVPLRYSAVYPHHANTRSGDLLGNLTAGLFRDIVVIQRVAYGSNLVAPETAVNAEYKLQTLFQSQLSGEHALRISRVLSIRPDAERREVNP